MSESLVPRSVVSHTSAPHEVVLPVNRRKSDYWCAFKAQGFRAMFLAFYGIRLDFTIGHGHFEDSPAFKSLRDVNAFLTAMLPARPQVCFFGDQGGAGAIACLAQLVPAHVCLVSRQDEASTEVLVRNVNNFFSVIRQVSGTYGTATVETEAESYDLYASRNRDRRRFVDGVASLHNRHPWDFMKQCPKHTHFHLLDYEADWNFKSLQRKRAIQCAMRGNTPEENFRRVFDSEIQNDLEFFEGEASQSETLKSMDEFFIQPMLDAEVTCDVIVVKLRGRVDVDLWEELERSGSALARMYAIVLQIEEFPNERDERLVYNPTTKEFDMLPDASDRPIGRKVKASRDAWGGIRGQFHVVILQERSLVKATRSRRKQTHKPARNPAIFVSQFDLRWNWYGPYMNTRDAAKADIYVHRDTHEVPCERILPGLPSLNVVSEKAFGRRDASLYTRIPARPRRIEVQIADLGFLLRTFSVYIHDCEQNVAISPSRQVAIIGYLTQCEYTYKYIDSVISQADRHDPPRVQKYAHELIRQKILLFNEVHSQMRWIERHNNWKLPEVPVHAPRYEDLIPRSRFRQAMPIMSQCLFPQGIDAHKPVTLGWSTEDETCHWFIPRDEPEKDPPPDGDDDEEAPPDGEEEGPPNPDDEPWNPRGFDDDPEFDEPTFDDHEFDEDEFADEEPLEDGADGDQGDQGGDGALPYGDGGNIDDAGYDFGREGSDEYTDEDVLNRLYGTNQGGA